MIETLDICCLMPINGDLWFINQFTSRNNVILESDHQCSECGSTQVVHGRWEDYCNCCGKIFETRYYRYTTYNGITHDMRTLNGYSLHLKKIEQQLKNIEPDFNIKYRKFKHRYYNLFLHISIEEYHISESDANDLFFQYFRGYYELNKKHGLKREKLIRRFLDKIAINPREYFIMPATNERKIFDFSNKNKTRGYSRKPVVSEGQLNVTDKDFTGRFISYHTYCEVNAFEDNDEIKLKYLRRYFSTWIS